MSSSLLGAGGSLLEDCPCLLDFISSVVYNAASEPAVLSFTLKLTGLLATSENGFKRLQVEAALLQLLISVGACKSVVESKTLSFVKPYLIYCPPLPHPLQECSVLNLVFNLQHWQEKGLWEDPCVRIGWIQGLKNLLQHPKALSFFVKSGNSWW